jgi:hypothetical protein
VSVRGADEQKLELPDLLAEVNARIRELAQREFSGPAETWEFRCECGAPQCADSVSLSLVEYEAVRANDAAVLAPGHRFLPGASERGRAVDLRNEARAVQAVSRLQIRRARHNVDVAEALVAERRLDLVCGTCGYGAVTVNKPPERCPMCFASNWRPRRATTR